MFRADSMPQIFCAIRIIIDCSEEALALTYLLSSFDPSSTSVCPPSSNPLSFLCVSTGRAGLADRGDLEKGLGKPSNILFMCDEIDVKRGVFVLRITDGGSSLAFLGRRN